MSNPLFSGLTKGALQALPYLQNLAQNPLLSSTEILARVRAAGLGIRTQTGLDIIGVLRNNITTARAIRLTEGNTPIPSSTYGQGFGQKGKFQFTVLVRGTDTQTGETRNQFVVVTSNSELTPNQIKATAETYGTGSGRSGGIAIDSLEIKDALTNPEEEEF
jgi:hypothetical protein